MPKNKKQKISESISVLFLLIALTLTLSSCSNQIPIKPLSFPIQHSQSITAMDTFITITLYSNNKTNAEISIQEAFNEIKRIEEKFNEYNNNSLTSILNKNKKINTTDKEFIKIIQDSLFYSDLTNSSFDITVKPILNLYTESFNNLKRPPTEEEITQTLKKINPNFIEIKTTQNITQIILHNQTQITLGGIVKGYAIDKALETLIKNNITSTLINAGGDMYALGTKPNNKPWTISLQNPDNSNDYITHIKLQDKAIATSGNYERFFNENKTFHHIVNPHTGYSANELISATIISTTTKEADALATAIFVMGPQKGIDLINTLNNTEALLITTNKTLIFSNNFPK
jgi:FAD:protein FMN transferase